MNKELKQLIKIKDSLDYGILLTETETLYLIDLVKEKYLKLKLKEKQTNETTKIYNRE